MVKILVIDDERSIVNFLNRTEADWTNVTWETLQKNDHQMNFSDSF
jgi:hypothetical protein